MSDSSETPIHLSCRTCRRSFPDIAALETHVMARGGGQMRASVSDGVWGEHGEDS